MRTPEYSIAREVFMGFLSFLTGPKKMMDVDMALAAKHVYQRLTHEMQANVDAAVQFHLYEQRYYAKLTSEVDIYVMRAHAMWELGIDHGLPDFQWTLVKRPLMVKTYEKMIFDCATDSFNKRNGTSVTLDR
ncbi:hypothetical protein [Fundidesulfovibrio magnetotacticus]|uniref:hypothetical protein n=1 Tax=Fundidesulfovibrio magnetotacticus TaxID=2730080 RepID=UPI001563E4A3|nr:hypothetical protein [Fundidesulfovibrio magnetotacticus]